MLSSRILLNGRIPGAVFCRPAGAMLRTSVLQQGMRFSGYVHPEQALAEKRAKVLAEVKKQVAEQLKQKEAQAEAAETAKKGISVCAANSHPNHRLQVAKERMDTASGEPLSPEVLSRIKATAEQPTQRVNDGISSGALAEKRLMEKRQQALEKVLLDAARATGDAPVFNRDGSSTTKGKSFHSRKTKGARKKPLVTILPTGRNAGKKR